MRFHRSKSRRLQLEETEYLVDDMLLPFAERFVLKNQDLLFWKKGEYTRDLAGVTATINIGKLAASRGWQRIQPLRLSADCIDEIERLNLADSLHVPLREGALDGIAQQDDELR